MAMIEEKVKHPDAKHEAPKAAKKATNVIDLMSVLEESLAATGGGKKGSATKAHSKASKAKHKKAA